MASYIKATDFDPSVHIADEYVMMKKIDADKMLAQMNVVDVDQNVEEMVMMKKVDVDAITKQNGELVKAVDKLAEEFVGLRKLSQSAYDVVSTWNPTSIPLRHVNLGSGATSAVVDVHSTPMARSLPSSPNATEHSAAASDVTAGVTAERGRRQRRAHEETSPPRKLAVIEEHASEDDAEDIEVNPGPVPTLSMMKGKKKVKKDTGKPISKADVDGTSSKASSKNSRGGRSGGAVGGFKTYPNYVAMKKQLRKTLENRIAANAPKTAPDPPKKDSDPNVSCTITHSSLTTMADEIENDETTTLLQSPNSETQQKKETDMSHDASLSSHTNTSPVFGNAVLFKEEIAVPEGCILSFGPFHRQGLMFDRTKYVARIGELVRAYGGPTATIATVRELHDRPFGNFEDLFSDIVSDVAYDLMGEVTQGVRIFLEGRFDLTMDRRDLQEFVADLPEPVHTGVLFAMDELFAPDQSQRSKFETVIHAVKEIMTSLTCYAQRKR